MKSFNRTIRSFNYLYVIYFSIKWQLEQGHILHRSPIFPPPSASLRVGLAGLLIIFSTVLPLPYPSGSPLDFYLCMHNSTISALNMLFANAGQMTHRNFWFASYFYYSSALSFLPPFTQPLFWAQRCLLFPQMSYIPRFSYSHRKVNQISGTLVAWLSAGFSQKLWTHSDLLCFLACCLQHHSWYLF